MSVSALQATVCARTMSACPSGVPARSTAPYRQNWNARFELGWHGFPLTSAAFVFLHHRFGVLDDAASLPQQLSGRHGFVSPSDVAGRASRAHKRPERLRTPPAVPSVLDDAYTLTEQRQGHLATVRRGDDVAVLAPPASRLLVPVVPDPRGDVPTGRAPPPAAHA